VLVNAADLTLSGSGSQLRSGASQALLENTLEINSGALRLLAGRSYTAASSFSNTGTLQLAGATFSAPGLSNGSTGQIFGFGTVMPQALNSGTVQATGGALAFRNGILGGSGTVQINVGSSLDLSAGSSGSSAHRLIHSGTGAASLNLGSNNFTVTAD
jgi:hypothetical protein